MIRLKKITQKWAMGLVILLSFAPVLFGYFYVGSINQAVALKDIPLYEGPSKTFAEKGKVRAGSKIILGDFREGWFYVEFPISLAGWINKDQLGLF